MKHKYYYLLLVIFSQYFSFGQVLDQANWATSTGTNFTIHQPTNQGKVGQSFTADVAGPLSQIKIDINVGIVPTTVDFAIYQGSGDTGSLLGTLPLSFTSSFLGEYTINTSSLNINMVAGNTYTLVFSNATPNTFSWVYTSGDTYTNGTSFLSTNGNSFSVISGVDMRFKTFVTPLVPPTAATHLNFDGINDYVSLPNESTFDFSATFTVEFWLKTTALPVFESAVISKGNAWGVRMLSDGRVATNASFMGASSTTNVADGNWHHVAAKFANSNLEIYVDGVREGQQFNIGITADNNAFNVAIGNNLEQANRFFNGNIDDLRIWNVGRTASQIAGARSCELQGNETGLLAYYKFNTGFSGYNNNETILLNDDSINSNDGSFNNMALNGTVSNFLSGSIVTTGSTIPAAPVAQPQAACLTTFADLTPPPSSTTRWYPTETVSFFYAATDEVFTSTYYFTTINANGCESERTPVNINVLQAPTTDFQIAYVIGSTATPLTATSGGTGLLWYTTQTGGIGSTTAPTPSTATLGSTTYWVSSTDANGCESRRSSIEVFITPAAPSNDECSASIPLTVGSSVTSNAVAVNLGGATDSTSASNPNCGGYDGGDVWYSVIVPTSGSVTIETFGAMNSDSVLEVYSGNCTTLNYLDCNDNDNPNDDFSRVILTNLTAGETVNIRVWEYNTAYSSANFQISAYYIPPPVNDECATSIALTVGSSSTSNAVTVNLTGATDSTSAPYPDCGSYDGGDVWFTAVVPTSGNLTVETFGATNWDTLLEIYDGTCTSLSYMDCNDNDNNQDFSKLSLTGLTAGETLYIRVWENDTENSTASFQISAYDSTQPATHLNFDGLDDYIISTNAITNNTQSQTYQATFKIPSIPLNEDTILLRGSDISGGWSVQVGVDPNGRIYAGISASPDTFVIGTTLLNLDTWYNVTFVFDNNNALRLYLNGNLEATTTIGNSVLRNSDNRLRVGSGNISSEFFNGDIDEVRVWSTALSQTEINNSMNCEAPVLSDLVLHYKLNQGFNDSPNASVTNAIDNSANGNNGTLTNFSLISSTSNWKSGSSITTGNSCTLLNSADFEIGKELTIYPNPSNGIFTIVVSENIAIEVYDIVGKLVDSKQLLTGTNSLDISNFDSGIYILKAKTSNGESQTYKLIKK